MLNPSESQSHAPLPLFSAASEGNPGRSPDRLAPADAARRAVRQEAAGIYAWLPLGIRVLHKIERIVREEMIRAGAIEILMPTLQPADLWRETGRYEAYGKEMLRINDRHERELLYGPTNEDMVTEIFRAYVRSPTNRCRSTSITSSGSSATRCGRASASCAAANS